MYYIIIYIYHIIYVLCKWEYNPQFIIPSAKECQPPPSSSMVCPREIHIAWNPVQQLKCLDKQIVFHTWKLGNAVFLRGSTSDFSRGNGIVAVFRSCAEACSPKSLTQTNNYNKKTIGLLLSGKHTVDGPAKSCTTKRMVFQPYK